MQNAVVHRQARQLSQSSLCNQNFPVKNKHLFRGAAHFGCVFLNVQPQLSEISLICQESFPEKSEKLVQITTKSLAAQDQFHLPHQHLTGSGQSSPRHGASRVPLVITLRYDILSTISESTESFASVFCVSSRLLQLSLHNIP